MKSPGRSGSPPALWFSGTNRIGRITPSGAISIYYAQISAYPLGASGVMARGSDGALWFANGNENSIGRITTSVTPKITRFAPHSGGPGTRVSIWGHSITWAISAVFNGIPARVIARSHKQIIVRVLAGDTARLATVTTRAGTATSATPFR